MHFRLLFGHYFGSTSKISRVIKKMYCVVFAIVITNAGLYYVGIDALKPAFFLPLDLSVNFCLSLFFESSIVEVLTSVTANKLLGFQGPISYRILAYISFQSFNLFTAAFLNKYSLNIELLQNMTAITGYLSLILASVPKFLLLDIMYERMRSVRRSFDYKYQIVNVIGKRQIHFKIINTKTTLCFYKQLLNSFDRSSKQMQLGVS